MRAVVISNPGGPEVLEVREVPLPEAGFGHVRVKVEAVGLNRADLLQRRGLYPAPPGCPPDIPGLEYAGVVDALGPGTTLRQVGERVMGVVGGGSFAEFVVVHERETVRVPDGLSLVQAAAIPEAYFTAYDALVLQCDLKPGERILIHAVGSGVGLAALRIALTLGCLTLGTSRTTSKLEAAARLGLQHPILVEDEQFIEACLEATRGRGVDIVLDLVGAAYLPQNLRVLAQRGRLIVVGLMGGVKGEMPLGVLLTRRLTMRGTTLRARPPEEKMALARVIESQLLPLFDAGRLEAMIDRVMSMSEVQEAHRRMEENATFGKIVLAW